ncbi:hypothetical protein QWY74_01835 [Halomonas almeriensis]|uniref:hypothetical protein n=1 Tax=Halomonas almeriensis TaxID=308163 RepID=UPI0025B4B0B1|nr:hypothetical protein [Halomonas almeriensis]MDN3552219.1 hypothetical protein [Halomonas almeriensis]
MLAQDKPNALPQCDRPQISVVHGGLDVHDPDNATTHVIATAAIAAFLSIKDGEWRLRKTP